MKRITSIMLKSLLAILISGGFLAAAHAQYDPGFIVDIPFSFSVEGQAIAAGTYQFHLVSSSFLMSVRNVKTGNEQMITVRPEEARQIASGARLSFQVCGGRSYLTEIHIPGTKAFSETVNTHKQSDAKTEGCSRDDAITIALR